MQDIRLWIPSNHGNDIDKELLELAEKKMNVYGLRLKYDPSIFEDPNKLKIPLPIYNMDTINNFINSKEKYLMPVYGGYTANVLLNYIKDFKLPNSKVLLGKSDTTCLLNALYKKYNIKSIYNIDLSKLLNPCLPEEDFHKILQTLNKEKVMFKKSTHFNSGFWYIGNVQNFRNISWSVLNKGLNNTISGISVGGNLESLTNLIGTDLMPDLKDKIVILDSVADIEPSKFIMSLNHIISTTNITESKAIVVGIFQPNSILNKKNHIEKIFKKYLANFNLPTIIANVDISHTEPSYPFYIGGRMSLDLKNNIIHIQWE